MLNVITWQPAGKYNVSPGPIVAIKTALVDGWISLVKTSKAAGSAELRNLHNFAISTA